MLCQFTVKNFKSIRDEMTFDMQATAISEHEDRVIKDKDGELYLPVSAIYGPNGGGKSMCWKHFIYWQQKYYAHYTQQMIIAIILFK